ncbi:MAG TPA: hypothetical protein PL113_13315, partial [Bacteroidia bacterium]|nr:hypothetical protein [Bacteroidia bacterium]
DDPIPHNSCVAALISVVLSNSPPAPLFRKERGAYAVAGFEDLLIKQKIHNRSSLVGTILW